MLIEDNKNDAVEGSFTASFCVIKNPLNGGIFDKFVLLLFIFFRYVHNMGMNKERLLELLLKIEESIITGEYQSLWAENSELGDCWTIMNCDKKQCPAYGRRDIRCWQTAGTFCDSKNIKGSFVKKWGDCRDCPVFKYATMSEEKRLQELVNNIVFSLYCFDSASLGILKIKRDFEKVSSHYKLTTREREILMLLLDRRSRKEMAKVLSISTETVKMHLKNIYRKLKVHSVEEVFKTLGEFCDTECPEPIAGT